MLGVSVSERERGIGKQQNGKPEVCADIDER